MIKKDSIYGSQGELGTPKTDTEFRAASGIESNRVALASDVNIYHNMSDKDLWVVCNEITNLLAQYGINPNNSYDNGQQGQLASLFKNNLTTGAFLTGIDALTYTTAPTQSGAQVSFPEMAIVFNTGVYYGNTAATQIRTTLAATTLTATAAWKDGVHFIFALRSGNTVTLSHQQTPVLGSEGATKCMLGSLFVINGAIQASSWKFQPWLQVTSAENREDPTAYTKGGFVSPLSGTKIQVGALEVMDEGMNVDAGINTPNIMSVPAANPFKFKVLYPGYDASQAESTEFDTTHIYNVTTGAMEEIPTQPYDQFIVFVPCIAPTKQGLMVPPMSTKTGETYAQVFKSQQEARNALFGLQYSLTNEDGNDVTERAIFLGQSIIVKVGATDFTDPEQFVAVGTLPQALAGFTSAAGQSGGGSGAYVPMKSVTWPEAYKAVTCVNNAVNIIEGNAETPVIITTPTAIDGQINQFEIHYVHTATKQGLTFPTTAKWWGSEPTWVEGTVYNIIFEYINGVWRGGYLSAIN